MKATIIENNARRNNAITINGFAIDSSDIEIKGSDKQVAWCRDILQEKVGKQIREAGEKLGYIKACSIKESELDEFMSKCEPLFNQVKSLLDGKHARIIIDNKASLKGILMAAQEEA